MVGIYKIINPKGRVYIGQSRWVERREELYRIAQCKSQRHLYSSIIKYGWEAHTFEVIHQLPEDINQEVLNEYERFYWQQYKDCNMKMLNLKEPGSNGKHSEETKQRIREAKKNVSEQTRQKMREAKVGKAPWNKGLKGVSEGPRKGKTISEEHKKKISESKSGTRLGYKHSEEAKQKMRESKLKLLTRNN